MIPRAALATELGYLRDRARIPVHFRFDAGRLHLTAQGNVCWSTSIEAVGTGEAWLHIHELHDWLQLVKDAEIDMRFTSSAAVFSHASGAVKIPTIAVRPNAWLESPTVAVVRLQSAAAASMIQAVDIASSDGYNAYIDGMLLESAGNTLTIGASNGTFLGTSTTTQTAPDFRTILGDLAVVQLLKTMRDSEKEVTIRLCERGVVFQCGQRYTQVPSPAGKRFPAYKKFMPTGVYRLDARTTDVQAALVTVMASSQDGHSVQLEIDGADLKLTMDGGQASVTCSGTLPTIKIAADDLRATLQEIDTERVELACDSATMPLVVRPIGRDGTMYFLVPTTK